MSEAELLETAWTQAQTAAILDKTMRLHFGYDDSALNAGEQAAVSELLLAGERLHALYLDQGHPQARAAMEVLSRADGRQDLKDLFRIMKGPVATTLSNDRAAFLNTQPDVATKNIYPSSATKADLEAFMDANPDRKDDLLHLRSVVRSATAAAQADALAALDRHPALDVLHPGLRDYIQTADRYFALPYSVAYSDDILFIYDRLNVAAGHMEKDDIAFARYLRLRARDLLADDYDGGDAAWVSSQFTGNLNAQIGSYETYDDPLFGVKSFFSLSLLKRDIEKSNELAASIGDIQSIEDALPYEAHKKVRENIPVGVYNIIADFGQARGTNTATILPNEGHLSQQYGRTILIRSTVLRNPEIFAEGQKSFMAAMAPRFHPDLELDGNFYRTLWHEIGHYLGPSLTNSGIEIDAALRDVADLMEEMKADLVSLFAADKLRQSGAYTDQELRAIYAAGVLRVLQKNPPRRSQAYGTMKLIQFNWYMDKGLLSLNAAGELEVDYDRYPDAVSSLLKEVLALQYVGDYAGANQFIDQWTTWDASVHGLIADKMKAAEGSRYRLVTYEALGENP